MDIFPGIEVKLQKMVMAWWCAVFLCLAVATVLHVHGETTDDLGFISIDCGVPDYSYVDDNSGIKYVSDAGYIDAGVNRNVAPIYSFPARLYGKRYLNVRSFPNGTRNCYALRPLTPGTKYLIRAGFYYGNYELTDKRVRFDLHLGLNFWRTIDVNSSTVRIAADVVTEAAAEVIFVCLINTGAGTPFISSLDLRPLKSSLYGDWVNASRTLITSWRSDMGQPDVFYRYPDDAYDRIWVPYNHSLAGIGMTDISTLSSVQNAESDLFEVPSLVMQTALTLVNSSLALELSWTPDHGPDAEYRAIMYFSDLVELNSSTSRQFNIYVNGELWYPKPFAPRYLKTDALYGLIPSQGYSRHNVTLVATANSTLPPILNAMEVYSVMNSTIVPSDSGDVNAIVAIKDWYRVKGNWMGDPCIPKNFTWDGISCNVNVTGAPRITAVNLSNRGLTGEITDAFARLGAVEYLDLSSNNLTGPIPAALADLPSLKILNLTNNQLNGSIPTALRAKSENGVLLLRIEGNPNLCINATSCDEPVDNKNTVATPIIVASCIAAVIVLLVVVIIFLRLRRQRGSSNIVLPTEERYQEYDKLHLLENRQFTYTELEMVTNNFTRVLGKGGFGSVYHGHLEDGTEVAVKLRSQMSTQGTKEFLAEAQHLTRVHHKNLVAMIGYCIDGDYLALVYEYMSQGSLRNHLRGSADIATLSWRQRLQIAIESAYGLEYLHMGCKPPILHRDVKTANILLSDKLEAKLADFGLSKASMADIYEPISTALVGTLGYLDPEYHTKFHFSAKSDVYSFGVVLLELITGQPPILLDSDSAHIVEWVQQSLETGNLTDIVDARMQGHYDLNSIWKAVDVALRCTAKASQDRLTMTEVVVQLKESLLLEELAVREGDESVPSSCSSNK